MPACYDCRHYQGPVADKDELDLTVCRQDYFVVAEEGCDQYKKLDLVLRLLTKVFVWCMNHDLMGFDCDYDSESVGTAHISLSTSHKYYPVYDLISVTTVLKLFGRTIYTWKEG